MYHIVKSGTDVAIYLDEELFASGNMAGLHGVLGSGADAVCLLHVPDDLYEVGTFPKLLGDVRHEFKKENS